MKGIMHTDEPSHPHEGTTAKRRPTIDLGACTRCGGCIEVAPEIFRLREGTGFVEVRDLDYYDPEAVEEAMKWCPEDCIHWEDE